MRSEVLGLANFLSWQDLSHRSEPMLRRTIACTDQARMFTYPVELSTCTGAG